MNGNTPYYTKIETDVKIEFSTVYNGYSSVKGLGDFDALISASTPGVWMIINDITLDANKTLPSDVTLQFRNAKINLGGFTLTGTDTKIYSGLNQIFDTSGTFGGDWDVLEYFPEWFGALGNGSTDDTSALDACMTLGVVKLSNKAYLYTNTNNRIDNVSIVGVKQPVLNTTETGLENGSIIVGTLLLKGKNPQIRNLGVDHGLDRFPVIQGNGLALASQTPFGDESNVVVDNVIALCGGVEDPYHAILVEGHFDVNITNIIGVKSFFGCALKNTRNNITNAIFKYNGSDNIIVKSDSVSGRIEKVNITNVICVGSGTTGLETTSFAVRVSAFDNDVDDVNISNIITSDASYSLFLDANAANAGIMKRVNINGVLGNNMGRIVLIDGGTGTGFIDRVNISNVDVDDIEHRPFEAKGNVGNIHLNNFKASNIPTGAFLLSALQVNPGVGGVRLNNVELLVDNDTASLGTANLANTNTNNFISGNNIFNLGGVGIPENGYTIDSSIGTAIVLTPEYTSKNKSIINLNAAGTRTVTTISQLLPSGAKFPNNYELTIINNASGTLTLQHGSAGFILNRGSSNFNIATNEIVKYTFFGSFWRQQN